MNLTVNVKSMNQYTLKYLEIGQHRNSSKNTKAKNVFQWTKANLKQEFVKLHQSSC